MIAILKALKPVSKILTDSAIAVRIHSDSRHASKQLAFRMKELVAKYGKNL